MHLFVSFSNETKIKIKRKERREEARKKKLKINRVREENGSICNIQ